MARDRRRAASKQLKRNFSMTRLMKHSFIVFKIINEQNSWQGAMRFLDKAGASVKELKIKLSP